MVVSAVQFSEDITFTMYFLSDSLKKRIMPSFLLNILFNLYLIKKLK